MIGEAELFGQTELMLVEVLGRIREPDWTTVMRPMFDAGPLADGPHPMRVAVERYAVAQRALPDLLAGKPDDPPVGDLLGDDPQVVIARLSAAARTAAGEVTDPGLVVHPRSGDVTAAEHLMRRTITHAFLAHEVAMHLGSTANPFPYALAQYLFDATAPDAAHWRQVGLFTEPLPLPPDVSIRDRFMLEAGRDPHALHH